MNRSEIAAAVGTLIPALLATFGWLAYTELRKPAGYQIEPHPEYCQAEPARLQYWAIAVHNDPALSGPLFEASALPILPAGEIADLTKQNHLVVRQTDLPASPKVAHKHTSAAPGISTIVPTDIPLCATVYQSGLGNKKPHSMKNLFGFKLVPQNKGESIVNNAKGVFNAATHMIQGHLINNRAR